MQYISFCIEWFLETSKEMLNWKPKVGLKEGVTILLEDMNFWQDAANMKNFTIANTTEK